MTQITISEIRITSSQIWINLNGHEECLGLYEVSRLLSNLTEKKIKIISREYHPHNDYKGFKNNFMFRVDQLLHNANYNRIYWETRKENKFTVPYWQIDRIDYKPNRIEITLRNLLNENLEDN